MKCVVGGENEGEIREMSSTDRGKVGDGEDVIGIDGVWKRLQVYSTYLLSQREKADRKG